jgi:hypothetical protein
LPAPTRARYWRQSPRGFHLSLRRRCGRRRCSPRRTGIRAPEKATLECVGIAEPKIVLLELVLVPPNPPNLESVIHLSGNLDGVAELVGRLLLAEACPVVENDKLQTTKAHDRERNQPSPVLRTALDETRELRPLSRLLELAYVHLILVGAPQKRTRARVPHRRQKPTGSDPRCLKTPSQASAPGVPSTQSINARANSSNPRNSRLASLRWGSRLITSASSAKKIA